MVCGYVENRDVYAVKCPKCGGPLIPVSGVSKLVKSRDSSGVWVWSEALVTGSYKPKITIFEGNTPLIKPRILSTFLKIRRFFLKDESKNPTGVYIDRGSATLITTLRHFKFNEVIVASTGDLTISISAYAKQARMKVKTFMPSNVSLSKAYKAMLLTDSCRFVETYDEAVAKALKQELKGYQAAVLATNPYLMDGYKTIVYEVVNELSELDNKPNYVVVPIGDGVLLASIKQAFEDLKLGNVKFLGVKARRETPLLREIYVEKPLFKDFIEGLRSSGKLEIVEVEEDEALEASELMIKKEGLMVGPVGSSCVASLTKALNYGEKALKEAVVVAVVTGDSLQDPYLMRALLERTLKPKEIPLLGFTKLKILEILAYEGPKHPYEIWKSLKVKHAIDISKRAVYQHLDELVESGLAVVKDYVKVSGRLRKVYGITDLGLKELK